MNLGIEFTLEYLCSWLLSILAGRRVAASTGGPALSLKTEGMLPAEVNSMMASIIHQQS